MATLEHVITCMFKLIPLNPDWRLLFVALNIFKNNNNNKAAITRLL